MFHFLWRPPLSKVLGVNAAIELDRRPFVADQANSACQQGTFRAAKLEVFPDFLDRKRVNHVLILHELNLMSYGTVGQPTNFDFEALVLYFLCPMSTRDPKCPYCVEDDSFRVLTPVGDLFRCQGCGHLEWPSNSTFDCDCRKCQDIRGIGGTW